MKWKPKYGEWVWSFNAYTDGLCERFWYSGDYDRDYKAGTIFRTKSLAQAALKKVKKVLKKARKA